MLSLDWRFSLRLLVSSGRSCQTGTTVPCTDSSSFTTNMTYSFYEDEKHNTYTQLIAFYLAARLKTAVHYVATAYLLPMIRAVMLLHAIMIFIPAALWIASIHVSMPARLGLVFTALFVDTYGQGVIVALFRFEQTRAKNTKLGNFLSSFFEFYPAINIEHKVERTNAFVSLVLGYSVVGVIFQSYGGYTVNGFLGKAMMGLVQAFLFNWIYFDIDGSNINLHAIRRSAASGKILSRAKCFSTDTQSYYLGIRSPTVCHGVYPSICWAVKARPGH